MTPTTSTPDRAPEDAPADASATEVPEGGAASRDPSLRAVVGRAIRILYLQQNGDNPGHAAAARATLARLRQAVGRTPEKDPLAWSVVLEQVLPDFPEKFMWKKDEPTAEESAAFTALTLYALHQRGNQQPMYESGMDLGRSVGRLAHEGGSGSIKPRFDALMAARTDAALAYQLRSLIALLSSHGIPTDHAQLAQDLVLLKRPGRRDGVLLRWGREFARGYSGR